MIKHIGLLFFLACSMAVGVQAQIFEIRIVNRGIASFSVQMRTTSTGVVPMTNDYVTDIVFGIRWRDTTNIELPSMISTHYNLKKAGVRKTKNNFHFQAFYADPVGFTIPSSWGSNQWIDIMTVNNLPGAGTAVFEICNAGFDITTEPNFALNFVDYTPAIGGSALVVLPVKFSNFEAFGRKDFVQLLWNTTLEVNSKKFLVQRSLNGTNFETIFELPAAGNSTIEKRYEHKDVQAVKEYKGRIVYYRIGQVDNDGRILFTETRKVLISVGKNTLKLAQNPVQHEALLIYDCQQNDRIVLQVIDAAGKVVLKKDRSVVTGNNQIMIPVNGFASGIYTIEVIGKHDRQSVAMTKM